MAPKENIKRGRPGVSRWAPVAEVVRLRMAGPTSPTLEEVAERFDAEIRHAAGVPEGLPQELKASTLRRFLAALAFVERFETQVAQEYVDTARGLRNAPVAAVELIGRWKTYDFAGAVNAAVELVKGNCTVEKLRHLEATARANASSNLSGRPYAHQLRLRLQSWGQQHFGDDYEHLRMKRNDLPFDIQYRRKSDERRAGIIMFGPYANELIYAVQKTDFLCKVVGVSMACERLVAIVPTFSADWWEWLVANGLARPNIELFAIDHSALAMQPIPIERPAGVVSE
jgi:hypothetical protein